jgi:hypothetical protein
MKFRKEVSGGIVTLKPEGRVSYTLEEGEAMEKEIATLKRECERWREVARRISWAWSFDLGMDEDSADKEMRLTYNEVVGDE